MDTWCNWQCPKCETQNKVCLGNLSDQTALNFDACECYSCGHIDWFEGIDEIWKEVVGGMEGSTVGEGRRPCSHCNGTGVEGKE